MKEEILDFINRRWRGSEELFTTGNCYWFARILSDRFDTIMYYMPVSGHFISKDRDDNFYDVTGLITPTEEVINLETIYFEDPIWYYRLMKNCRD